MKIIENTVVTLTYKMSDSTGNLIDSSDENGSLTYIHGVGMMMPGIEKAVDGKESGFEFKGVIEPEDGYGVYLPENVIPVPREQFGDFVDEMEEGKLYNFDTDSGHQPMKVVKIEDDIVTIDANHPYAGEQLNFECKIEDVRLATEEELESLNSHGCGCGGGGCCSDGDDCECDCDHENSDECCSSKGGKSSGCGCHH